MESKVRSEVKASTKKLGMNCSVAQFPKRAKWDEIIPVESVSNEFLIEYRKHINWYDAINGYDLHRDQEFLQEVEMCFIVDFEYAIGEIHQLFNIQDGLDVPISTSDLIDELYDAYNDYLDEALQLGEREEDEEVEEPKEVLTA